MLECLIMGDSIAVGVSEFRKECRAHVQGGITSQGFIKKYGVHPEAAKVVIISLGANDYGVPTEPYIEQLRKNTKAGVVFWLLPREDRVPNAVAAVKAVADRYGDQIIPRPKDVSADGIHPTAKGYKELAGKTKLDID
jgi:lysophospholipase L1-like esterase